MVVTTVLVKVKNDCIDDFIRETVRNHEQSIRERGNMRFDILQDPRDPSSFLLYEAYDTADSQAAHKQTAHYAAWRDAVTGWMAEPRKGIPYKAIKP